MEIKKLQPTWQDICNHTQHIARQIMLAGWQPDIVVGITRGGLTPAVLLSQYLNVPMQTLSVSLRDGGICESNTGLAEDAFGYHRVDLPDQADSNPALRKKILIVDDINDSGATIDWICKDWQSLCLPSDTAWQEIWGENVRFAVIYNNEASGSAIEPSYVGTTINKLEDPIWVDFPWESWWQRT